MSFPIDLSRGRRIVSTRDDPKTEACWFQNGLAPAVQAAVEVFALGLGSPSASTRSRLEGRSGHELTVETARLDAAVRLGDLLEGDSLDDTRPDGASCKKVEEPLEILPEPGGMLRPHEVD